MAKRGSKRPFTKRIVASVAAALVAAPLTGHAGPIYTFVDQNGISHFSNVSGVGTANPFRLKTFHPRSRANGRRLEHRRLVDLIHRAARVHKVDPALIRAMVEAESGGDPGAVSGKGATGLMQLMPDTADELCVDDPMDPWANLNGGARYFRRMLDRFNGDVILALAAYNAGPGAVERCNGLPNFPETRQYVKRVLLLWRTFKLTAQR